MKTILFACMFSVGCAGASFEGEASTVSDAGHDATEVDALVIPTNDIRADMLAEDQASDTVEASTDAGGDGGASVVDAAPDAPGDAEDGPPSCGEEEVYPQPSPTCARWIATTPYPLEKGCCRKDTHTCGHVVAFSPFCVEVH